MLIILIGHAVTIPTALALSEPTTNKRVEGGGEVIVPIGLAASTLSSEPGWYLLPPRTLQALAKDDSFPSIRPDRWLSSAGAGDGEPENASRVSQGKPSQRSRISFHRGGSP